MLPLGHPHCSRKFLGQPFQVPRHVDEAHVVRGIEAAMHLRDGVDASMRLGEGVARGESSGTVFCCIVTSEATSCRLLATR